MIPAAQGGVYTLEQLHHWPARDELPEVTDKATRLLDYPVIMATCRSNLPQLRARQLSSVRFIAGNV
jgi:hypothetical protein